MKRPIKDTRGIIQIANEEFVGLDEAIEFIKEQQNKYSKDIEKYADYLELKVKKLEAKMNEMCELFGKHNVYCPVYNKECNDDCVQCWKNWCSKDDFK